ncbi:uncharacterized protein B0H18DRAFT_222116 [Fomitopsis serialis]|uniref:uncharacterized protein n=1 Tax=Fomitopsis serialis TaxID=139415 RepID=UPI002008BC62|nr:uncharacterized protein B0H18DRAFT_222116 [Neoantrodia serialis]KAH9929213.1 hypothetical protein B0H18DRAFT_222116 [Neoantrodia serialis]
MLALALTAFAGLAVLGVSAAPQARATSDPSCPVLYTPTTTETISIIAPTYTGPYSTATLTETLYSFPIATSTT